MMWDDCGYLCGLGILTSDLLGVLVLQSFVSRPIVASIMFGRQCDLHCFTKCSQAQVIAKKLCFLTVSWLTLILMFVVSAQVPLCQ